MTFTCPVCKLSHSNKDRIERHVKEMHKKKRRRAESGRPKPSDKKTKGETSI